MGVNKRGKTGRKAGKQVEEGNGISNGELESSKKKNGEKRRNHRKQYRKPYQPYAVSKAEFIADGME